MELRNDGNEALRVDAIAADSVAFRSEPSSFELEPGATQTIGLRFAPEAVGPSQATLRILSNDPAQPEVVVELTGVAVSPPAVAVSPSALTLTLGRDETAHAPVQIANVGASRLDWRARLRLPLPPAVWR